MREGQVFISPPQRIAVQERTQRGEMSDLSFILHPSSFILHPCSIHPPTPLRLCQGLGVNVHFSTLRPRTLLIVLAMCESLAVQDRSSAHVRSRKYVAMPRAIAEAQTFPILPHGGSCGLAGKDANGGRTPFVWHNRQDLPVGAERTRNSRRFLLPDCNQETGGPARLASRTLPDDRAPPVNWAGKSGLPVLPQTRSEPHRRSLLILARRNRNHSSPRTEWD